MVITGNEEPVGTGLGRRQDTAHPAAVAVASVAIKPAAQRCPGVPTRCPCRPVREVRVSRIVGQVLHRVRPTNTIPPLPCQMGLKGEGAVPVVNLRRRRNPWREMLACNRQRTVGRKIVSRTNPGDRQVVPATTFLGDRLDEVGLACLHADRRRSVDLTTRVVVHNHTAAGPAKSPDPIPDWFKRHQALVSWRLVARDVQNGTVICRQEELIITGLRRMHKS